MFGSWALRKRGNVEDAVFHVAKEAFGAEVSLNPLQDVSDDTKLELPLCLYHFNDDRRAHYGFVRSVGCEPVVLSDNSLEVTGCSWRHVEWARERYYLPSVIALNFLARDFL